MNVLTDTLVCIGILISTAIITIFAIFGGAVEEYKEKHDILKRYQKEEKKENEEREEK